MASKLRQLLELNLATLFIGTSGPLGRAIDLPADYNIFLRCVFAAIIIFIIIKWTRAPLRIQSKRDLYKFILSGALLCGHWVFYFIALKISSVAIGVLSLFTFPVMTTLLEPLFFKTRINFITLINSLLIIVGVYVLVPEFDLSNTATEGVLWGLLSALLYAIRNLINKTMVQDYSGTTIMFYQVIVSCIILSFTLFTTSQLQPSHIDLIHILILSVVTTSIGHIMFVRSLKNFSASTAGIASSLQPIYGIIIGFFYLRESPSQAVYIGGCIILLTVLAQSYNEFSRRNH